MLVKRLGISGVGLIGGSLGLAVRQQGLAEQIIGIGRDQERLQLAVRLGAIDTFTTDFQQGARECDLLYLSTPVSIIIRQIRELSSEEGLDLVVTDAGSTKREILRAAAALPPAVRFVGGHPMTGSEEGGVLAASQDLFQGSTYVITPDSDTDQEAAKLVASVASEIGAGVVFMDPESHDRSVAAISHLPHVIAGAFLRAATTAGPEAINLAAGSFRDLTRVSDSSPELWRDICTTNADCIRSSIGAFKKALAAVEDLLQRNEPEQIERWFSDGRKIRTEMDTRRERKRNG